MAIIAVAGGTGNVGRAIVDAIVAGGKHQVKILSRKSNPDLETEIGVPILPVDYSDVDAIVKVLEDNKIDTVISGIAMHSADGTTPNEVELIRAAERSNVTKRLIASDWGIPYTEQHIGMIPSILHKWNSKKELLKTKTLQHTVFYNGYFMDYWGVPGVQSYLGRTPVPMWLDMVHNAAARPGSGDVPGVFTHTTDVGRFVAASLDMEEWPQETFVYGDKLTWNQFLRLAEEAKGTEFTVADDSVEKLRLGQTTELPSQVPLYQYIPKSLVQGLTSVFGLWLEQGEFDLKPEKFLNETFPDIKPMTMKEMLDKAWAAE